MKKNNTECKFGQKIMIIMNSNEEEEEEEEKKTNASLKLLLINRFCSKCKIFSNKSKATHSITTITKPFSQATIQA